MNLAPTSEAVIPLPSFPFSHETGIAAAGMRRFGIFESDLAIDFADPNTPKLVTRLLKQCIVDPDGVFPADYFRDLAVGKRLECLLTLAAGEHPEPFNFPFHCSACEEELVLELTLEEIAAMQRESDAIETVEVEVTRGPLRIRKPSGRDQEKWARMAFRDERDAAGAMIGTLAVDSDKTESLSAKELDLIDEAMGDADPLVNFLCRIGCAECGAENEISIDLAETALRLLQSLQQQLVVMVHKLASHYHWSEREIFEVPYWRRKEYLELIAAGR